MCPGGCRRRSQPADDPEREIKIGATASVSWTYQIERVIHFFASSRPVLMVENERQDTFFCDGHIETSYWAVLVTGTSKVLSGLYLSWVHRNVLLGSACDEYIETSYCAIFVMGTSKRLTGQYL
jgi:hypothetical protein